MSTHKLPFCPAFLLVFLLATFLLSCTADKQQAVRPSVDPARGTSQVQSQRVTDKHDMNRSRKSLILLKSTWGDTIALYGCVGIFAGENSANLRYAEVVNRLDKELGINIKKMSFDEVSDYSRNKFFSNGIQSISIQKSSLLQKSIGLYRAVGSDRIQLVKASKIYKSNWMGKAQLYEEKLDIEFLSSGKSYNSMFHITHGQKQKPKTRWAIVDESRSVIEKDQAIQLSGNVKHLLGYLCGRQGLRYILPATMCRK